MMMPANFSAIAENEMRYVAGGALVDVLAPVMTEKNWKTFNTNMVRLVGDHYVQDVVNNSLGVIFSGHLVPGAILKGMKDHVDEIIADAGVSEDWTFNSAASYAKAGLNIGLNIGLHVVGNAAAIYNLSTGSVGNSGFGMW